MLIEKISAIIDKNTKTFMFTEAERDNILQQADGAGFIRRNMNEESSINYSKKLEQLKKKEITLSLHIHADRVYKTSVDPTGIVKSISSSLAEG